MSRKHPLPLLTAAAATLFVACQEAPDLTAPLDAEPSAEAVQVSGSTSALIARAIPEVMALPQTVFADLDEATGIHVFGVETPAAIRGVQTALARLGIPASGYRIQISDPIHFASTNLRSRHRPTQGGIQIHWSQYVCTLGFNVDHSGGRSFITNSHCTKNQGSTGTTAYYQPSSSADPAAIAIEADDPAYFKGGACSVGKVCRYSDASRALYQSGTESTRGSIAKTTGVNSGSLSVSGNFTITGQNNTGTSFSGTVHKVGRTTGWTSGGVSNTCATVNVLGSNIQLLCQTLVENDNATIVQGGDSGSPVFQVTSGDNVTLVGILWGGNSSGSLFVFSPLKSIQDELGGLTATSSGTGGGTGDGGGDDGGDTCVPKGPNGRNCK
jgi:hypothetical protein